MQPFFSAALTVIDYDYHPGSCRGVAGVVPVMASRGVVVFTLAGLLFPAARSSAQHQHPPQDEPIHEKFYSTWMQPDKPNLSCCGQHDCYPTEARNEGGLWFAQRREDRSVASCPA
jgi:hypothetical protein